MKNKILLCILLFGLGNSYAQDSAYDKIEKQGLEIDGLKRALKTKEMKNDSLQMVITTNDSINKKQSTIYQASEKKYVDTIQGLKKELSKLEKYKSEKKASETILHAKNDSIASLKDKISQKENEINAITEKSKKDAVTEKENGKNEVLNQLVNTYRNNSFDELINSSSMASVQRDKQLIGNIIDIKQKIIDLEKYFTAKMLLSDKFNPEQVNHAKSQVTNINQQSKLDTTLIENLDNYKSINDGLNTAIQKIIAIDQAADVKGMSEQVVKLKLNKILAELSKFIFDYNFNSVDYPYLSEIVLEIIKRKQPNPDADISDLLNKI